MLFEFFFITNWLQMNTNSNPNQNYHTCTKSELLYIINDWTVEIFMSSFNNNSQQYNQHEPLLL